MSFRKSSVPVVLCLVALATAVHAQPASYLAVLSGSSGDINVFNATSAQFGSFISFQGPAGTLQILPRPDAAKYYVISNTGGNGISSVDASFSNLRTVGSVSQAATVGVVSPDGRRLIAGAGNVYVFDSTSSQDTPLTPAGLAVQGNIVDMAVGLDSKRVYILSVGSTASYVTAFNLSTLTQVGSALVLAGGGKGISVGPNGLVYVSAVNRLYEVDPGSVTVRSGGETAFVATPAGKLAFTPDGKRGLLANKTPIVGNVSVLLFDLVNRGSPQVFPPAGTSNDLPVFDQILVAGNNRAFAVSSEGAALYDVTFSPFNVADSALSTIAPTHNVVAAAVSNELPAARYLFLEASYNNQTILQRIDLTTNQPAGQTSLGSASAKLAYLYIPPQSGASSFLQYNDNQTLAANTTTPVPLVLRVMDSAGRPVWNANVTFSTSAAGASIATPNVTTSADGFAQTYVTAPDVAGSFTVAVGVSGSTQGVSFTLTVPGSTPGGGGGTAAGGTFIVSGNGQLVIEDFPAGAPFVVIVKDATGTPVPNTPVSFAITQGHGVLTNAEVTTGTDGIATTSSAFSNGFIASNVDYGLAFEPTTIIATSTYGTATFVITTALLNIQGTGTAAPAPTTRLLAPTLDTNFTITAQAGQTATGAVKVGVISESIPQIGIPIPNIGVRILNADDTTAAPAASCAGGIPLTDATGIATCDLVVGCKAGTFNMLVDIGELRHFPVTLNVTRGSGSALQISSGDNQSGRIGQTLSQAIVATVTDSCGSAVSGATVQWTVTQGSGTLSNVAGVSDTQGHVSAVLTLGNTAGVVRVQVSAGSAKVTFTATANVTVASIVATSGSNQSGFVGQTFPQTLVATVLDTQSSPVPAFPVTFSVVSGSASVNPATVNTDTLGRASTTVTAGASPGQIVISAAAGTFTATFTLSTRLPGPSLTAASFINAAGFQAGLSPCALATAKGTGLAPGLNGSVLGNPVLGPMPYTLTWAGGVQSVSLTVGGIPAPLFSVTNLNGQEQLSFQAPCELATGTTTVAINVSGGTTTVTDVPVVAYQPGIFTFVGSDQKTYAVALRPDGSYVTPTNPAKRGETVLLFVTGLGQVTPATATNRAGIPGQDVAAILIVGVNNGGAQLEFAQYMEGVVGVYVVAIQIPSDTLTGSAQPLAIAVASSSGNIFGNPTVIPITQ